MVFSMLVPSKETPARRTEKASARHENDQDRKDGVWGIMSEKNEVKGVTEHLLHERAVK